MTLKDFNAALEAFLEAFAHVAAVGGFDPPLIPISPHPFYAVEGNRYCGVCGGGMMHSIHATSSQGARE